MNIAWLTGADSSVGYYLALELALQGWSVVATGTDRKELERLAGRARGLEGRIMPSIIDLSNPTQAMECVQAIEQQVGPITHALFCHTPPAELDGETFSTAQVERALNSVLISTARALEAIVPYFSERRVGVVGILNSYLGYRGMPGFASQGAAFSALETLCESMRFSLERRGVRLMLYTPGLFEEDEVSEIDSLASIASGPQVCAERFSEHLADWGFEHLVPSPLTWGFRILRLLPNGIYRRFIRKNLPDSDTRFAKVEEHEAILQRIKQEKEKEKAKQGEGQQI